jgi:AraC-like DNA-binding protein
MSAENLNAGHTRASMTGRRFSSDGITVEAVDVQPAVRLSGHAHPYVHCCCIVGGCFDESSGRGRRRCASGSSRISPGGDRHNIDFGPDGARCVLLILDEAAETDMRSWRDRLFFESESTFSAAARLFRLLQQGNRPDVFLLESATWELVAQLDRWREKPRSRPVPGWLRRVHDRLLSCPEAMHSMGQLARAEAVSREHLARAFRSHFHTSPAEFLQRVRLDRACRRLLDSDEPIAMVAAECGFADQSHLTRVCRHQLGLTPAAVRRKKQPDITSIQDFLVPHADTGC